jgi:ferredoxin
VHVLVHDDATVVETTGPGGSRLDLGHLAVAHREAFVAQSSMARPAKLVEILGRMAGSLRPAVALLRCPIDEPLATRPIAVEAALRGRACPEFCYDPDLGPSWADRFDVGWNPDPDRAWPVVALRHHDGNVEATLDVALTWVDAVAGDPKLRRHFCMIPPEAWEDAQVPLGEYLERADADEARLLPYIWVLDDQRVLGRAIVSRELVAACRERQNAWRVVQELGGFENSYALRAARDARDESQAELEERLREQEAAHDEALERVRAETARESMERLAAVLLDVDAMGVVATAAAPAARPAAGAVAAAPAVAEAAPAEAAPAVAEEEEEEALAFDEPYIDTPLCTSCNECTNLNPKLFVYNANKQAEIGDPSAGTFAELVKAAEACPARCIHPAKPRAGDDTATDEMIKRAAKFN